MRKRQRAPELSAEEIVTLRQLILGCVAQENAGDLRIYQDFAFQEMARQKGIIASRPCIQYHRDCLGIGGAPKRLRALIAAAKTGTV